MCSLSETTSSTWETMTARRRKLSEVAEGAEALGGHADGICAQNRTREKSPLITKARNAGD